MTHAINVQVVAVGVEEVDQLDFLTRVGCDYAQGFLFPRQQCVVDLNSRRFIGFYSTVVQSVMNVLHLVEGATVEICASWLDSNTRYHTTTQKIQHDYQKSLIDSINQLRKGVVSNASINTEKRTGMLKAIDSIFKEALHNSREALREPKRFAQVGDTPTFRGILPHRWTHLKGLDLPV